MHRITLPLSAFANPTCELVDENTIVITAEPNNLTPTQEPVDGADPLMGTAGTPGAWWRNRMSASMGILLRCICSTAESQRTKLHVHLPLPVVSFLLHGFTVRVGHVPWESGGKIFLDPRLFPYFLNEAVGESRTCEDTLETVKWWFCYKYACQGFAWRKNCKYILCRSSQGMNNPCLLKLQWEGDSPVNCSVSS